MQQNPNKILVLGRPVGPLDPLRQQLEQSGFQVTVCADLAQAADAAQAERASLIVLEPEPPASLLDGLEVRRKIRQLLDDPQLPVLVLANAEENIDKVIVLEPGADDFVLRPYDPREVIARIRMLLRKTELESGSHAVLAAGPIELDVDRYSAAVDGQPVVLTAKEFDLLRTLIEARGRVVRREAALEKVWNYDRDAGIESRTLDVHIRRLRKKLGSAGSRIMTIRSVGYRMNIAPSWAPLSV